MSSEFTVAWAVGNVPRVWLEVNNLVWFVCLLRHLVCALAAGAARVAICSLDHSRVSPSLGC